MPHTVDITSWIVDTCYPDYLTDLTGILVGVERNGQTRDELAREIADAAYEHEEWPEDAIGDYVFDRLVASIAILLPRFPGWRFWPIDKLGNEITDEDAEFPDEQPSIWMRFTVEVTALRVKLTNNDDGDDEFPSVLIWCDDGPAAMDDQTIDGSSWECAEDAAYTTTYDRPGIVADLESQGYDVDTSEYSPPDA